MIKPKVLFLCSYNGCRTQITEAFLRDVAGERFEALSAAAEGSTLDGQRPKRVDLFLWHETGKNTGRWFAMPAMKSGRASCSSFRSTHKRRGSERWNSKT